MNKKILAGSSLEVILLTIICVVVTTFVLNNNSAPVNEPSIEPEQVEEEVVSSLDSFFDEIKPTLESMTLEEKVGQLLFARIPADDAVSELEKFNFGGYILFGRDVEGRSLEQIKNTNSSYKNSAIIVAFRTYYIF